MARCLVKHAESALEAVKEVEKYEVCLNDARSRKYLRFVSEVCSQKHMLLTQAGINAIESGERLQLNHLVSSNGYVGNSGIARMLLIALCDGAL
ncbi:hypothetical protein [Grapevine leafroll-associated virus 3m]|nr:hypothetical protein [Grapevine leafroll-associated virus 3m]